GSDDFGGTSLDPSWTVLHANLVDITVGGGALGLSPHPNALWYNAGEGPLVYKLVTGDFKATTVAHARKKSNPSLPPDLPIEVGGVRARAPADPPANYVFLDVGYAEMNQLAVEHKSTTSSSSVFGETASPPDLELRLCRTGATFTALRRDAGSS